MKKISFEKMETIQAGWAIPWYIHTGCAIAGVGVAAVSAGIAGPAAYLSCMLISGGPYIEVEP